MFYLFLTSICCFLNCLIENGSEEFLNFVQLLGGRIKLKNWDKFNGGLDVKSR